MKGNDDDERDEWMSHTFTASQIIKINLLIIKKNYSIDDSCLKWKHSNHATVDSWTTMIFWNCSEKMKISSKRKAEMA